MRSGLTPASEEQFDATVTDIWTVYRDAPALAAQGERLVSTDALTGVQALERQAPNLPLAPGKGERRECAYLRHGTRACILRRDVVSGHLLASTCGPTRTEADLLGHVQGVVATAPTTTRWHVGVDNLNRHQSASLVRWVATVSALERDLGEKGQRGILHTQPARAAFLSDPSHRRVFHDTPKHGSWLNQIDIGRSILVRKLLKRGAFVSVEDLTTKVLAFIDSSNRTMAKPFKWTYQGKPLVA
jgi:DDE superfamily endonuclease